MTLTVGLSLLFGLSGVIGAFAAFRKIRPERESFIIEAAKGAVLVQSTILDELQEEVERVKSRAEELAAQLSLVRDEQAKVLQERDYLRTENEKLHTQVERLERRVGELERNGVTQ